VATCPTCGKTFDERRFHVLVPGLRQTFDRAECALVALESGGAAPALAAAAPAGGAVVEAVRLGPRRAGMMGVMRARVPFGLLLAALAASAILSVYLWLRAFGAGPSPRPTALVVPPAEARHVATLPGVALRKPLQVRHRAVRRHVVVAPRRPVRAPVATRTPASSPAPAVPSGGTVVAAAASPPPSSPPPSSPPPSSPSPSPPPPPPSPPSPPAPLPPPPPSPPAPPPSPPPAPAPSTPATTPPPVAPPPEEQSGGGQGESSGKPGWGCGDKHGQHTGPPGKGSGNGSPC
jgi:hypothetical protein